MLPESAVPTGSLDALWERHQFDMPLITPNNRKKFRILVVGTGLAGASAAATLGELGYEVAAFCIQDSPRRAHSIAAQGGINAAKNYCNDGDSVRRLFYATIKGGDYRAREANVWRLAETSNRIIDHCVAQGIPFAREYGGFLENRSFGGAQVSRTFYARGQTGQQLLVGAYSALMRQVAAGQVTLMPRREVVEIVTDGDRAVGIVVRNLVTGEIESHAGHAVVLATGGYGNVYHLSTNAMASNASAIIRAWKKGALLANPCFVQVHPTCIPVQGELQSKLTLMSESLRNDGRIWVPKTPMDGRMAGKIPDSERDYYLESRYPTFGNLVPRDVASRNAKEQCDAGKGVGTSGRAVYLDFRDAIKRDGEAEISRKYGNLFAIYERISGESPMKTPMRIYPAVHYTMGGLWVDYHLMTSLKGLFAIGEANFSDHGANRLGASALMQGLCDGYFVLPATLPTWLSEAGNPPLSTDTDTFKEAEAAARARISAILESKGTRTVDSLHRELGACIWEHCGISRTDGGMEEGTRKVQALKERHFSERIVTGEASGYNEQISQALRVEDFLDLGDVMFRDGLARRESCGCHFNENWQTEDGEALRDDAVGCHVAAWEYREGAPPVRHAEALSFREVELKQRSYK